jgi:hypothetical protein
MCTYEFLFGRPGKRKKKELKQYLKKKRSVLPCNKHTRDREGGRKDK